MHVTVCYSKSPVDWDQFTPKTNTVTVDCGRDGLIKKFGDATVLSFSCSYLQDDHDRFVAGGASHDYDAYRPHLTISYGESPEDPDPYDGKLVFGPEIFQPVKKNWSDDVVAKADESLADQLNAVIQKGAKPPIDLAASLTTSRLVTLGFLTQAQQDGHTKYQVDEVLDDKTCPVCMEMNGTVFDVGQQYDRTLQALGAGDPADLASIAPWPDLEGVQGVDPAELQSNGYGAPPYHPGCRGMLSVVDDDTAGTALGDLFDGAEPDAVAEDANEDGQSAADWDDDAIQQLGWDRYGVTDPEAFKEVDDAYQAGDYDQAQALIDKWKDDNGVQKADPPDDQGFEGPNAPKKKRKLQTPAGQLAMDHDDIASDSSSIAFESGVMNDMNAPIDLV